MSSHAQPFGQKASAEEGRRAISISNDGKATPALPETISMVSSPTYLTSHHVHMADDTYVVSEGGNSQDLEKSERFAYIILY